MSREHNYESDPLLEAAISELQGMIRDRWPAAKFEVTHGDDPEGVYLDTTVDIDDPDEVMDLVVDRLVTMQVDEGLPVHVVPLRPAHRVVASMQAAVGRPRIASPGAVFEGKSL